MSTSIGDNILLQLVVKEFEEDLRKQLEKTVLEVHRGQIERAVKNVKDCLDVHYHHDIRNWSKDLVFVLLDKRTKK